MRVWLKRISGNCSGCRRRLVEQNRNGDISFTSEAFRVDSFGLLTVGAFVNDVINQRV
jgi:hypothetical protein